MRVLNSLMLTAALAFPISTVAAYAGTITVTGEATVDAAPDMATISFGMTTDGVTAAEAMSKNNLALAAVIDRLKSAGVAEADLQTSSLTLNPNWVGYESGETPTIAGYVASNMLNVRVRDLPALGGILDQSITDGANTLNGITFELANPRPVQDAARKAAIADAAARAALFAEAAGVKLGAVSDVIENQGYGAPMPVFKAADAADSALPVASGQIGIMASVTVVFLTE
jgi:uncharacterized protein YggE